MKITVKLVALLGVVAIGWTPARRFKPVGFSFALVGLDLLLLAFRPWFLARLDPVGRIWRPIAVRTFFEGRGGYWPYENSGLPPVH